MKDKTTEENRLTDHFRANLILTVRGTMLTDNNESEINVAPFVSRVVNNPRSLLGCELKFLFFVKAREGGVSERVTLTEIRPHIDIMLSAVPNATAEW